MKCEELELFKKYEVNVEKLEKVNGWKETVIEKFLIPISFEIDLNDEIVGVRFLTDTFMEMNVMLGKFNGQIKTQNVRVMSKEDVELIDFVLVGEKKEEVKIETTISNNGEVEFLREIVRNFSLKG